MSPLNQIRKALKIEIVFEIKLNWGVNKMPKDEEDEEETEESEEDDKEKDEDSDNSDDEEDW